MPLSVNRNGYDPNEKQGYPEGRYKFKTDEAAEKTAQKPPHAPYLGVKFLVAIGNKDVTCFRNFSYSDKARRYLDQFFDAIGLDFMDPNVEAHDVVNRFGEADFKKNKDGYLEPVKFYKVEGASQPASPDPYGYGPPAMDKDSVPF